ncbi:hypothetical protein E2C01_089999 [Portunus trituberculatus]|uniref:Uncharacterized protein n=1 Tax=Portunus trituberculatus TaxID=210409 RepID=A0A5B7JK95_PORTR|nr:hypothetical protein [Portunus trituberculatus]
MFLDGRQIVLTRPACSSRSSGLLSLTRAMSLSQVLGSKYCSRKWRRQHREVVLLVFLSALQAGSLVRLSLSVIQSPRRQID